MYIRDKRSPVPKSEAVSRVMSANRAKNTKPEIQLRKALWHAGLKGYRLHYKPIPGRPDIAFVSKRVVIFVNGCYWHRCPTCNYKLPRTNPDFWQAKFERNVARDRRKVEDLEALSWKVITVWECDLKNDLEAVITTVINALK